MSLHPLVVAAAEGTLPPWSRANPERIEHMGRVAELLGEWAVERGLTEEDVLRWRAAGFLHDALREADPEEIRRLLPTELSELPDYMVHGPAAASRLRREGVFDEPFLRAIAYHTIGTPGSGPAGAGSIRCGLSGTRSQAPCGVAGVAQGSDA